MRAHRPAEVPDESLEEDEEEKRGTYVVPIVHMDSINLYGSSAHSDQDEKEEKTSVLNTHVSAEPEDMNVEEVSENCHQMVETPDEIQIPQDTEIEENWYPTGSWYNCWKSKVQFGIILSTLNNILSQIGEVLHSSTDEKRILATMKQTTMVGIRPAPHPLVVRKIEATSYSIHGSMSIPRGSSTSVIQTTRFLIGSD